MENPNCLIGGMHDLCAFVVCLSPRVCINECVRVCYPVDPRKEIAVVRDVASIATAVREVACVCVCVGGCMCVCVCVRLCACLVLLPTSFLVGPPHAFVFRNGPVVNVVLIKVTRRSTHAVRRKPPTN